MASRRFFGYDPYDDDYYYPAPYRYAYPYYQHQASPARSAGGFFPAAARDADRYYTYQQHEPAVSRNRNGSGFFPVSGDFDPYYQSAPARSSGGFFPVARNVQPARAARPEAGVSRPVSEIPVHFVDSDLPEPEAATMPVKRSPSAEAAAVRLQAAARGFLARRAVRALRAVEREAEGVAQKVAREAEELRGDARARIAVGEELMRLLLRLDAVRGAREYRRRVTKRVLALQDAVDALEQRSAASVDEAEEAFAAEAETTTTVDEAAADLPASGENDNVEMEDEMAAETDAQMEVDAAAEETEPAPDKPADKVVEDEWEMVADEPASAVPAAALDAPQPQEAARQETTRRPTEADGGVGTKKLMEMVAALCEQSAHQCAVIGALAERVDALERAVRRVEDAERRRRRAKKLRKEGRGSNHKCYSD